MFDYQADRLKPLLSEIARENISPGAWSWLQEKILKESSVIVWGSAFVAMPRKTGKSIITLTEEQNKLIQSLRPGLSISGWTADRLGRVWLLLHADPSDREKYTGFIEGLFLTAEVNELSALYAALPLLAYPQHWIWRCTEGIRSNIGDVLQAIICNNPYPAEYLPEPAWNQLVLKAFFTEKPVHLIIGLDRRSNKDLANTISDYAHERWAASRPVNPQLWRCVGRFIDERIFPDIERLANSEDALDREAGALACRDSGYAPAKALLDKNIGLRSAIESGRLSWQILAEKIAEPA
ncbi:MAG TPA: EboA domain-containing protein [Flavitalea sp.]|nr:EboA domain-containing protein [Flavitalea sp.]